MKCTTHFAASLAACVLAACGASQQPTSSGAGESHAQAAADFERGPHRGRLLRDGDFSLELQIFEDGVPPEFHVFLFEGGKPLAPSAAQVSVDLTRLDGEVNTFAFAPDGEFLRGNGVVHEPHSFSVKVQATRNGKTSRWHFDSFEGRVAIPAATAKEAGIEVEAAGPATIAEEIALTGRAVPNAERLRAVTARFPGPVRTVMHSVGDVVKAGDALATVESNESLKTYTVTAPLSGTIIERRTNPGEAAGSEPLFVIADYGALWAEFTVFPRDLQKLRNGLPVRVRAVEGEAEASGTIVRLAPAEGPTAGVGGMYVARVALDNRDRRWAPGQYLQGQARVNSIKVPLAVKRSGLQAFRDFTVVFEQVGESYEVRMLELGRQDETFIEVKGGLKPGAKYVAANSYLIKADIEKSGASHDH
ncbi:MAG: efflux RND transporter periplasmic adaptor subunit [Proteobacteria bacterium]|nr:efflux RND transporter periplasmic adaptor subunit [Pseudomonadota bacterium]